MAELENTNVLAQEAPETTSGTNEKEKAYTLKSVQAELKKLEKSRDKKEAKIKELNAALKVENKRIKELQVIYNKLRRENTAADLAETYGDDIEKLKGVPIELLLKAVESLQGSNATGSATSSTSTVTNASTTNKE